MNAQNTPGNEYRFSGPPPKYRTNTQTSVQYLPVTLRGEIIGYLWASGSDNAASYVRRLEAQDVDKGFDSAIFWSNRLRDACGRGLSPLEALRQWVGAPEDPVGGMIASGSAEAEASNPRAVAELANPGNIRSDIYSDTTVGTWPDGTPFDRSKGWDDFPLLLDKPGYSFLTESAVRYVPVTRQGVVLGYLWVAVDEDAASFIPRLKADVAGNLAMGPWISRLDQAKQEGLSPMEALRRWTGRPEDARAGGIAADAEMREAPSMDALKEIANQ